MKKIIREKKIVEGFFDGTLVCQRLVPNKQLASPKNTIIIVNADSCSRKKSTLIY
jgi:hypothetical protein